jgi:hypothetical protein
MKLKPVHVLFIMAVVFLALLILGAMDAAAVDYDLPATKTALAKKYPLATIVFIKDEYVWCYDPQAKIDWPCLEVPPTPTTESEPTSTAAAYPGIEPQGAAYPGIPTPEPVAVEDWSLIPGILGGAQEQAQEAAQEAEPIPTPVSFICKILSWWLTRGK